MPKRLLFWSITIIVVAALALWGHQVRLSAPATPLAPATGQESRPEGSANLPSDQQPPQNSGGAMPDIESDPAELALQKILRSLIDTEFAGGPPQPQAEAAALTDLLAQTARTMQKAQGHDERLCAYRYMARFMADRLEELSPGTLKKSPNLAYFCSGRVSDNQSSDCQNRNWTPSNPDWCFGTFSEGVYRLLFKDNTLMNSEQCLRTLLAVRTRDTQTLAALHRKLGYGQEPQWPLEVFRQLFTYATDHEGQVQWQEIAATIPADWLNSHKNTLSWGEIGYGNGKIFTELRRQLGPQATILAVEIDPTCRAYAQAMTAKGYGQWGQLKFIEGTYQSCALPPQSVDVIHPAGLHIGDGGDEIIERDWLPWLNSAKQALKPGGLLLIDDGGSPDLKVVRSVMQKAGFRELKLYRRHNTSPAFCVSFTPDT